MTSGKTSETIGGHAAVSPETDSELILAHLKKVLASQAFRNSKRYTRFLTYVVEQTLLGHGDRLKERLLGIEVFDRPADYDVAIDPIVRVAAGEIRKRLAQYYMEDGHEDDLHIQVHPGAYVPEFSQPQRRGVPAPEQEPAPPVAANLESTPSRHFPRSRLAAGLAVALLVAGASGAVYLSYSANRQQALDRFWDPFLHSTDSPVFCLGDVTPHQEGAGAAEPHGLQTGTYSDDHLALADVKAFNRISAILAQHGKQATVLNSGSTTLADLRQRTAVFVGGSDNQWTMRALESARFRIVHDFKPGINAIVDSQNGLQPRWIVDFGVPYNSIQKEYGIIARFHSPLTDQTTVIVAGIGANGTIAASDFVATPDYFKEFADRAPRDWDQRNMEIILETEMIHGDYGPPKVVTTYFW